jgi:hypothetical protein
MLAQDHRNFDFALAFALAQVKVFGGRGNLDPKLWQIFCGQAATSCGLGSEILT